MSELVLCVDEVLNTFQNKKRYLQWTPRRRHYSELQSYCEGSDQRCSLFRAGMNFWLVRVPQSDSVNRFPTY